MERTLTIVAGIIGACIVTAASLDRDAVLALIGAGLMALALAAIVHDTKGGDDA